MLSYGLNRCKWQKWHLGWKDHHRRISTELTTALRPFYFAVHPDLFGQHPVQRRVNEENLKQLSSHIESLYERKYQIANTKTLQFYIRDGISRDRDTFKLIKITFDQRTRDPKTVVQRLLELCSLPTDSVKNIKATSSFSNSSAAATSPGFDTESSFRTRDYDYGSQFTGFEQHFYKAKEENKKSLDVWIATNAPIARTRAEELVELKEEVEKLQKSVVQRLGLLDARYDCGWNFEHYRGCLKTLERMASLHEKHMGILRGRIVVFGLFTGVSLEGHIMLYTGDVLNSWVEFIQNIPKHDYFLQKIPFYEHTLSQVLRNITIGRRKFMPKQQAKEYAGHLMKVTTTLGDYLTVNKFPKPWPVALTEYQIVIESEAGPLMVNPTGQLIAPATIPGFMLVDFITANMALAKERMWKYKEQKYIERELVKSCTGALQLKSLTKDDSVTPDKMIEALNKLKAYDDKPLFQNIDLHITNYYSVSSDGVVCIPWNFFSR